MSVFQNMNQLAQTPIKGAIAGDCSPSVISCQVYTSSVATLVPGDYVTLIPDVSGNTVIVDKAGLTDQPFGAVVFNPKKDTFVANDMIEVVLAFGIMFMEAGGAIDRGDQLQFTPTGSLVITNAGNPVCGIALDEAAGNGSVLRVLILYPLALPVTITSGSIDGTAIGGSTPSTGAFTTLTSTSGTISFMNQTPLIITAGATPAWAPGAANVLSTLTPGENETIAATTTGAVVGETYRIKITTSGSSSYTITFGANFKTTGTLATGTASGKIFVITFVFDGTNFVESCRTTAI